MNRLFKGKKTHKLQGAERKNLGIRVLKGWKTVEEQKCIHDHEMEGADDFLND